VPNPATEPPPIDGSTAVLELLVADRRGPCFALPSDRATTLGRSSDADIPLGDRLVSRLHASIRLEPTGWTLRDLGSRNGTRLDGAAVGSSPLHAGALIGIGTFTLVFHTPPPAARPTLPEGWKALRRCPTAELVGDALQRRVAPTEQAARLLGRHVAALRLLGCASAEETATAVVELALAHCAFGAVAWFAAEPAAAPLCSAPEGNRLTSIFTPQLHRAILDGGLAVWLTPATAASGPTPRGDLLCIPVGPSPAPLLVAYCPDSPLRSADGEFLAVVAALAAARHQAPPATDGIAASVATARTLDVAAWQRALIAEAVRRHDGNVIAAARALGMSRATLYRRLGRVPKA